MLFERSPARYHRARPAYPDGLWDVMTDLGVARPGARVLDLGAGTGQATGPLLARGARVDAVEPGRGLATMLAEHHPGVDVQVAAAESATYPADTYDGVVCATALHWMDLARVLPRIAASLRPGAPFVAFWHVFLDPGAPVTPFRRAVDEMFGHPPSATGTPLDRELWTSRLTGGRVLQVDAVHEWAWEHQMSTGALLDLLHTFNGWSTDQIAQAASVAEDLGGEVAERYRTIAYVCRASA